MTKGFRFFLGAVLLAGPGLMTLAQEFSPPAPRTTTGPAAVEVPRPATAPATVPAASRASTLPSAQSVLESILNDKPVISPEESPASTNPGLTQAVEATAPNEPKANRIREGQFIWDRTGRLTKDDKTGTYMIAFDADGKGMTDPPMALLPSHLLMAMEDASEKGTRAVKFKVSGEVTEYRGKNFLYVRYMQTVRDLNQGIGG